MQWTPDTALALLNEWRCSTLSKPEFLAMKGLPAHALKYAQRIVSGYDVPTHHPRVVTLTYTYEQFREMADTEDVNVLSRVAGFLAWRDIIPLNDPRIQSLCLFLPDKVNVAECIRILSKFPVSVNEFDRAERRNYPSTFNLSRPARRPTDAKLPRAAVIFNR